MSQMSLALLIGTSAKHVSFIETGRAVPSRELLMRLADGLDVPVEKRNLLMLAAGYAPVYGRPDLRPGGQAATRTAKEAVSRLLSVHDSCPVLVYDSSFDVVGANHVVMRLLRRLLPPQLLSPEMNTLRLSLHPAGLARYIANFPAWRRSKLNRLRDQLAVTDDERLRALYDEVAGYEYGPGVLQSESEADEDDELDHIVAPLRIRAPGAELNFYAAVTVLVAAGHMDLSELSIATFYPVDRVTAAGLSQEPAAAENRLHYFPGNRHLLDEVRG